MKKSLLIFLGMSLCAVASAQKSGLAVSQVDSLPALIQYYLEETTSKHFEDPKVPRFLLKDRTDNFVFGVGGAIDARVFYDYQGNRDNCFAMNKDDEASRYDNDVVDFTHYATNLVFKILGKTKLGVIDGMINMDFGNAKNGARLLQAYVDVFGLRIGKTNTGFRDDVSIDLIDCFGDLNGTFRKIPQVSYSYRFKNGLRVQAGVEFSQSASVWLKGTDGSYKIDQFNILLPDLTANVYYNGKNIHLYCGVNSRIMTFVDSNENSRKVPSYAVQAGMCWPFVKATTQTHKLFLHGIWAHGMADCCCSLRSQGLSAVFDPVSAEYVTPNVLGGSLGYQAAFGKNRIDFSGSVNSVSGHKSTGVGEMYDWAVSGVLNYMRTFLTYGTAGVEVVAGRRYNLNGTTQSDIRAYLSLKYNF